MEKDKTKKEIKPESKRKIKESAPLNMETQVYNQNGKELSKLTLPEDIFGLKWNADLVHQVIVSMESNARTPIAHAKNRGEVSGGGKKPWKQKGTGRARHGSTRSPIWVHGGSAHGPRNDENFARKINKKMKAKALYTVLSAKFKDGKILFIDSFSFANPKSKDAKGSLLNLSKIKGFSEILSKKKNSAFLGLSADNLNAKKSFSNFSNIATSFARNMNPVELLNYKYIVLENPEQVLKDLEHKFAKN